MIISDGFGVHAPTRALRCAKVIWRPTIDDLQRAVFQAVSRPQAVVPTAPKECGRENGAQDKLRVQAKMVRRATGRDKRGPSCRKTKRQRELKRRQSLRRPRRQRGFCPGCGSVLLQQRQFVVGVAQADRQRTRELRDQDEGDALVRFGERVEFFERQHVEFRIA